MVVAFLGRIDIQSMARTQPVGLAEVRNYSEFFIIFILSKESAYTTVACVYMDYKRLMILGKM